MPLCRGLKAQQDTTTGAHPQKGEERAPSHHSTLLHKPISGRRSQTACSVAIYHRAKLHERPRAIAIPHFEFGLAVRVEQTGLHSA